MNKFEVICVDMYQTLVDIHSRIEYIWKRILKDDYNYELSMKYARLIDKIVYEKLHDDINQKDTFKTLREIFESYFQELFMQEKVDIDYKEAAKIFIEEHASATSYDDASIFLKVVSKDYPVCLVSDADEIMILPLLNRFEFNNHFISEQVKSYKNSSDSKIFKEVINNYSVDPNKIIHIGDSSADIIGAKRVGIKTCWVNRNKSKWKHKIQPDYEVESLIEVFQILDIK